MTGYGCAEGQLDGVTYVVEIKTVNNRYFKAKIRLPDSMAFLEEDIERLLRKELSRGMVNYVLQLRNIPANVLFDVDETGLKAMIERLGRVASSLEIECSVDIGGLLTLPGMLMPVLPDEEKAKQVKRKVLSITQEAMDSLKQMRAAEGAALAADLESHCEAIKNNLEQIRSRSTAVVQEYHRKLKKRVGGLLAAAELKLDEATLAREVAILADRSDISEEIARLDSHLQQFAEACRARQGVSANGQIGRRLDFITQEMLREANTIASKASDTEIARYVVDIKCRVDRLKEQVQNVE